jgi:hypothetical protein
LIVKWLFMLPVLWTHTDNQTLLYSARAVHPTLLAALSTIAERQSNGTQAVADACHPNSSTMLPHIPM